MILGYKEYSYERHKTYYLTINGIQFGGPLFSMAEVNKRMEEIMSGECV
jgi:hypothetical protein